MAINKKLIHFKKYETFNGSQGINGATEPTNGMYGNIPEHSIVFIQDAKKIWTHGQLYDCDQSALEEALSNKANINGDYNEDFEANLLQAASLKVGSIRFEDSGEYPYIDFDGINYANGEVIYFPEYNEQMQSSTLATLDDVSGKVSKSELENYLPKSGGSLTGNLHVGNVKLYKGDEDWNGGIDLVSGSIEASEVNDFSYVQDSQGNNLQEILDTKAGTYTITDFSAYDIDEISKGTYTLQINPSSLEGAIRNNKVILIQHESGMEASPVLDAYIEDQIYLTVMYNSCIYQVFIELDQTVLTSASIDCIYNKTDLITDSVTISNAMTITKDANDYAHLNISEGLIVDNIIEWKDGSTTVASIDCDGSASFSDLTVAGKNVTSFLTHHNSNINVVTSLSNVPTNKAVVFAHVGTSQELVFDSSNLVSGRGVHVFIYNNSSTTPITIIPQLDGSTFLCDNVTEFEIPTQSIAEVSMVYLNSSLSGSQKFIRSITV